MHNHTYSLDDGSFVQAVRDHYDEWLRYARRLTGNENDASDVLQDALVKISTQLKGAPLHTQDPLKHYMYGCIKNAFKDRWKKEHRHDKVVPYPVDKLIQTCDSDRRNDIFGSELTPLIDVVNNRLGNREATVLVMHDVQHFTYREIASLTAIGSPSTIQRFARKARATLREYLEQQELDRALKLTEASRTSLEDD